MSVDDANPIARLRAAIEAEDAELVLREVPGRCPAETWSDDQKRVVRCVRPRGHDGHHSRMAEFWGIVWPDEKSM